MVHCSRKGGVTPGGRPGPAWKVCRKQVVLNVTSNSLHLYILEATYIGTCYAGFCYSRIFWPSHQMITKSQYTVFLLLWHLEVSHGDLLWESSSLSAHVGSMAFPHDPNSRGSCGVPLRSLQCARGLQRWRWIRKWAKASGLSVWSRIQKQLEMVKPICAWKPGYFELRTMVILNTYWKSEAFRMRENNHRWIVESDRLMLKSNVPNVCGCYAVVTMVI